MKKLLHWRDEKGEQLEQLVAEIKDNGIRIRSVIINHGENPFACHYTIECNRNWQFRHLSLALTGADKMLDIRYDYEHWYVNGLKAPYLEGVKDIDLSVTPFTNSLPINRLKLQTGDGKDIAAAYISVPDMDVRLDPQRYTRLGEDLYRYESLDSDFRRDVRVDEEGFVLDYQGLFTRQVTSASI